MPIVTMPDGVNVQFPDDMPKEQIRGLIMQKFPDLAAKHQAASLTPTQAQRSPARMIEVELPDGSIAEFPDGTDPTVIKGALQKKFPPPASPANMGTNSTNAQQPEATFAGGSAGAAGLGAADMASFGFGDELGAGLGAASEYLASKITGDKPRSYDELLTSMRTQDQAAKESNPGSYLAGQAAGALGTGAGLARGGLSLTANAIGRGTTLPRVAAMSSVEGGLFGSAQGFGSGEGGVANRLSNAGTSGVQSAVVGAAAPIAMSGLSATLRRAVSPMRIAPERQAMVDTLRNEGIELTAGQTTGNKTLAYMESELGGGRGADFMERQGEQFTAAALRRAGIDANRATPEVMDQGFTQLGQQFDDLAARNAIVPDRQMVNDIRGTIRDYRSLVPESSRAPIVENITRDILTAAQQPGGLSGAAYQAARSRLDTMARAAGSDPHLSNALRSLRNNIDDTMERSITANNPADAGAWATVRNQYRNMLVLEKAATGAGENAAAGLISPSQLRNAVVGMGRRAYARGQGDLSQLARAGERLMKALPNSGTAPRTAARNVGMSIPAILGAGAGTAGGPMGTIAGGVAGAAIPFAAGRALLSGPGRAYLSNQVAANPILSQGGQGILGSIMNQLGAGVSSGRIAP